MFRYCDIGRPRSPLLWAATVVLALAATGCSSDGAGGSDDGSWSPRQDVQLIVHASAGGSSDLLARTAAKILSENGIVDQTLRPENRVGGSGAVAYTYLLGQSGNPHAIATISGTFISTPASGQADYRYSKYTNFAIVAEDASLLAVSTNSPYQKLDDLVRAAKDRPGKLRYGGTQTGGSDSIVHYLLQDATGTKLSYVPFSGGGETNAALLGGNVDVIAGNPAELKSLIDGKRIRPLAVTTPERLANLDVPTFREQGVDLVITQARGFIGPPNLTAAQRTYWQNAFSKMVETAQWQEYRKANFLQPAVHIGPKAEQYLDAEWEKYTEIYKKLGLGPK